ncbi:hypothetical protein [Leuconostoc citreum]
MSEDETKYYRNKILSYIYFQPEHDVSINKIINKFHNITRDEMSEKLNELSGKKYIQFGPKLTNNAVFISNDRAKINDNGTTEKVHIESAPLADFHFVTLTLSGKEIVEYKRSVFMRTLAIFISKPLYGWILSYILGWLTAYFIK